MTSKLIYWSFGFVFVFGFFYFKLTIMCNKSLSSPSNHCMWGAGASPVWHLSNKMKKKPTQNYTTTNQYSWRQFFSHGTFFFKTVNICCELGNIQCWYIRNNFMTFFLTYNNTVLHSFLKKANAHTPTHLQNYHHHLR